MSQVFNRVEFVVALLRRGRIRLHGTDFVRKRQEALTGLEAFVPSEKQRLVKRPWHVENNTWVSGIAGQLAFLKESLKTQSGHLTAYGGNIAYVRIPRAASTSLSYTMLTAHYPLLEDRSLSAEQINFLADANLEVSTRTVDKRAVYFTVVRNPFSRIVSVYREFFERASTSFLYEDYLFGILKKEFSFGEFVRTACAVPMVFMDQHIRPQHCFLSFYDNQGVDVKILKLEEPEKLRSFLAGHRLHMLELNRSETAYDYRDYYDRGLLQAVRKVYSMDFARFGYPEEIKDC